MAQLAQQLDVDDELLVAGDEPALEPAGRVHDEVGARQERRQERHQRLVRGLGVDGLRRVERAAAAPRQAEVARDLARAQHADPRLGRPERRRARLHVGVGQETSRTRPARPGRISCASAIPASASAICCTSVAGSDTGDIAPISRNGVITTAWLAFTYSNIAAEHPVVVAQRRVDVDQADRDRRALDRLASAEQDLAHPDRVGGVRPGRHRAHVRLVATASAARTPCRGGASRAAGPRARRSCRPGESSSGKACASRTRFSKSAIFASRRTSPSRMNGHP